MRKEKKVHFESIYEDQNIDCPLQGFVYAYVPYVSTRELYL